MSCSCGGADRCGCCEGPDTITPRTIFNRPGLPALSWRVGEHADFFETMRSRIGQVWVDVETTEIGAHGRAKKIRLFPLRGLRTRDIDDPSIALLDLWSVVADVLSFYTERLAQEGYLRTATELQSVIELGRLVGYLRRPGVAASVYLAFFADDTWKKPLVVPVGARVQSLPEPGESPVFFETDAALPARAEWNVLLPRRVRPAYLPIARGESTAVLYFEGTATRLAANAALLLSYGDDVSDQVVRHVAAVEERFDEARTKVTLLGGDDPPAEPATALVDPDALVRELERRPSIPPASPAHLSLSPQQAFGPGSAVVDGLVLAFHPDAADGYAQARANAAATQAPTLQAVSALRVAASVYGNTAPPQPVPPPPSGVVLAIAAATVAPPDWAYVYPNVAADQQLRVIDLDATHDEIVEGSWVVIDRPAIGASPPLTLITRVEEVGTVSRADYNLPAKVTRLRLADAWLPAVNAANPLALSAVRSTTVLAAPEPLPLAGEAVDAPVCGGEIELDGQADGLQPGRWLVITGERAVSAPAGNGPTTADVFSAPGVKASELTMLADVRQDTLWVDGDEVVPRSALPADGVAKTPPVALPGDRVHTFLQLATPLAYCYKRETVRIYANVAHATHGETRVEPLGSGDPTQAFQSYVLKNSPLTYVVGPDDERRGELAQGLRQRRPLARGRQSPRPRTHGPRPPRVRRPGRQDHRDVRRRPQRLAPSAGHRERPLRVSQRHRPQRQRPGRAAQPARDQDGRAAKRGQSPAGLRRRRLGRDRHGACAHAAGPRVPGPARGDPRLRRLRRALRRHRQGQRRPSSEPPRPPGPGHDRGGGRHPDRPDVRPAAQPARGAEDLRRPVSPGRGRHPAAARPRDRRRGQDRSGPPLGQGPPTARGRAARPLRLRPPRSRRGCVRLAGDRGDAGRPGRRLRRPHLFAAVPETDHHRRSGEPGHRRRPASRSDRPPCRERRPETRRRCRRSSSPAPRPGDDPLLLSAIPDDDPRPSDRLYDLLPAIYRMRDADAGPAAARAPAGHRRAGAVVEDDIGRSTTTGSSRPAGTGSCPTSATSSAPSRRTRPASRATRRRRTAPRATILDAAPRRGQHHRHRRRKGTLALLEAGADSAGWPARAVESSGAWWPGGQPARSEQGGADDGRFARRPRSRRRRWALRPHRAYRRRAPPDSTHTAGDTTSRRSGSLPGACARTP